MRIDNATALGTADDTFRLVWYQNINTTAEAFGNGQFWQIQRYDPALDDDDDPTTGEGGWVTEPVYTALDPKPDLVSGMGSGDDYIVFENQGPGGSHLIFDINSNFGPTPQTLTYPGTANSGNLTFTEAMDAYCFAAGTLLQTPDGLRAVEDLQVGDLVMTRDRGPQPIRWKGARRLTSALRINPKLKPIRIRAGAIGDNVPVADLVVSPQHRVLVRSRIAERMSGSQEVLVPAKQLLNLEGVDIAEDLEEVTYFHFLFDQHEIVVANGAETETLYTGPQALKSVGSAAREEIFTIFPELRDDEVEPSSARPILSGRMARRLAMRHLQQQRPLVMQDA